MKEEVGLVTGEATEKKETYQAMRFIRHTLLKYTGIFMETSTTLVTKRPASLLEKK